MIYIVFGLSIYFYLSIRLSWIVKATPFTSFRRLITGDYPYPWGFWGELIFVEEDPCVCPIICKQLTLSRQNG